MVVFDVVALSSSAIPDCAHVTAGGVIRLDIRTHARIRNDLPTNREMRQQCILSPVMSFLESISVGSHSFVFSVFPEGSRYVFECPTNQVGASVMVNRSSFLFKRCAIRCSALTES
jgi:hypothetical protein